MIVTQSELYSRDTVMDLRSENFSPGIEYYKHFEDVESCSTGNKGCCGVQMARQSVVFCSVKCSCCLHLCFTLVLSPFSCTLLDLVTHLLWLSQAQA